MGVKGCHGRYRLAVSSVRGIALGLIRGLVRVYSTIRIGCCITCKSLVKTIHRGKFVP